MLLTLKNMFDEIDEFGNDYSSDYAQLLLNVHTMAVELEAHKGKRIKIGSSIMISNEGVYELDSYHIFKVKDGLNNYDYSFSVLITVKDSDGKLLTFDYSYIDKISSELVNTSAVKYYVTVRSRVFDDHMHSVYNKEGEDYQKLLEDKMEYGSSDYRFLLLD